MANHPIFLIGESQGQRILVGHSPQGHKELDTTEATQYSPHLTRIPVLSGQGPTLLTSFNLITSLKALPISKDSQKEVQGFKIGILTGHSSVSSRVVILPGEDLNLSKTFILTMMRLPELGVPFQALLLSVDRFCSFMVHKMLRTPLRKPPSHPARR